ncbi:hypothetical protein K449DRAFT_381984 [Hypoxylon sp. EC38]|nr:hypothetical protein K449DRAFT_381984 [Hypoxylon sp. EC38]
MSACACGVACPSLASTASSASTISIPTTLTTSITTSTTQPGGNAQTTSGPLIPATSTNSASDISNSTVSGTSGSGSLISLISSSSTAVTPSSGGDSLSGDPGSSTQTTASIPDSSLSVSLTASASTIIATASTISASSDPSSVSLNGSITLTSTTSGLPGAQSSFLLSTSISNSSSSSTVSSDPTISSSARWTNTTCTSETMSTSSVDPSAQSLTCTSGLGDPVSANLTTSLQPLSTPLDSPFNSTSTGPKSETGIHSSETTCISTSTEDPIPDPTSWISGSYHYFNTTTLSLAPFSTGGVPSAQASSGWLPLSSNSTSSSLTTWTSTLATVSASPTCTTRSDDNGAIENGDFEAGLSPWSIDLVDIMSTSYSVANPGANGSCGAFHVSMKRNTQTDDLRSNLRLVSPLIALPPPGSHWMVSFWIRFGDRGSSSYLNLFANQAVAHRVDAADTGSGNWTRVEFPYVFNDDDRMLQFVFSFVLGDATSNEVWIDKVALEVTAETTSTSAGPVLAVETSKPLPKAPRGSWF